MDARKPSPSAGERLKELRVRLGLSTRDVEEKSQQIAEDKHSREILFVPRLGDGH